MKLSTRVRIKMKKNLNIKKKIRRNNKMSEYDYNLKIFELEKKIEEQDKKMELFNKFLIELLDKERLQQENDYLKEQLFKLSKDPKYKTYYP